MKNKVPYENLQEIEELIEKEEFKCSAISLNGVKSEIETVLNEQDEEIARLLKELEREDEGIDVERLESSLQSEVNKMEKDVIRHLNGFTEFCPIVGLSDVQNQGKIDEEINNLLVNYAKMMDLALDSIDISVYQQCLRSPRGEEFADLCQEKKRLENFAFSCVKQKILAIAAYEKYVSAMKSFEELLLNEDSLKPPQNFSDLLSENNFLTDSITAKLNILNKTLEEIDEISVGFIDLQNIDFLMKKAEFRSAKTKELLKMHEFQKKQHLLCLGSIVSEQERVQSEYDKLFQIQILFEELNGQSEFRVKLYQNLKNRADLVSEERKTIDERDFCIAEIKKEINEKNIGNFKEVLGHIAKNVEKFRENQENSKEVLQSAWRNCKKNMEICRKALAEIRKHSDPEEKSRESSDISLSIQHLESKLQKASEKFENLHKSTQISPSNTSEREIFIQYLTSAKPFFLSECDI